MPSNAALSAAEPDPQRAIHRITWIGIGINLALTAIKGLVGILVGSVALIADALHSLSDLVTDGVVLLGAHFSSRPPDESHPFGHGKLETLAAVLIAAILAGTGIGIIWQAIAELGVPETGGKGWWILGPALLSVVLKEWLYHRTVAVSRQTHSSSLYANAWHHRTDSLSSVVVVLSAVALLAGWPYGDQTGGLLVGLMIVYAAVKIAFENVNELGEAGVDRGTQERLREIITAQPGVASWHRLRATKMGREILMDVHVLVKPTLTVKEGHDISKRVENAIRRELNRPISITVHIEPDIPSEKSE